MKLFQEVQIIKNMLIAGNSPESLKSRIFNLEIVQNVDNGDWSIYEFAIQKHYKTVNSYRKSKLIMILDLLKKPKHTQN